MKPVLAELLSLLSMDRVSEHEFIGPSQDLGWGAIFGGQCLGQGLSAAEQTVPEGRCVHSLHGYFLRQGDAAAPVRYVVDPVRDGRSFSMRRVVASQRGKAIFTLAASFSTPEAGLEHADPMPQVAGPDGLISERERALRYADKLPPLVQRIVSVERPVEVRMVEPYDAMRPAPAPAHRHMWYRAVDALPDDPALHRYLLAYASDFHFLGTTMLPHGVNWLTPGMRVTSLDHALWFHRPFRADEWLLYEMHSPSASDSRGLAQGRFFSRDGQLVATVVQEGLIRDRRR